MASPVEEMQDPTLTSIAIEPGNTSESLPIDPPKAKSTVLRASQFPGTVKQLLGDGITRIVVLAQKKLICPIRDKWTVAGEGVSVHGNGTLIEPGHEAGDLEDGGSVTANSQGGFTDNPDQEGTEGLIPEEADEVSVGAMLLDDLTDSAKAAKYLKHSKTYLTGFLIYGLHSSLGTLKEGFPRPTAAKKTLWYLLFGNVGTIFVLFTVLARAPRGSARVRLLVKSMTAAGVLMFGLNLALLYLKYQP